MNTATQTRDTVLELQPQREYPAPAPVQQRAVAPTPGDLLADAYARGASPEVLAQFLDLKAKFEAQEARKAFVSAMARFKADPPEIIKDKAVGYEDTKGNWVGYKHATLASVCRAAIEGLASVGISHSWAAEQSAGLVRVRCTLTHDQGHSESVQLEAPTDTSGKKNAIQAIGSSVTYLERYTLLMITGLATADQDDDGRQHKDPAPDWSDVYLEAINAAKDKTELESAWKTAAGACRRKGNDGRSVYDELKLRVETRLREEFGATVAGEKKP